MNADRSLLHLSIRVGEIAVRDSHLVRIQERLDGNRVKVQDLATGESSDVELSSLRGRSAVANGASIDAHLELARASTDVTWQPPPASKRLPHCSKALVPGQSFPS
jgi:hypothetical protein